MERPAPAPMRPALPDAERAIRTTCPYCGVGCGVLARGADQPVAGDPAHPANRGRLCSKGAALTETLGLSGRLLHPHVDGQRSSWDAALDLVAGEFTRAVAEHGPDSVAFYVSGQLLTEDYYVANKLMKGYIGSANIDTNSRLCMASSVAGHKRAFGTDTVPGLYDDLEQADLVVLTGSNAAWCHPVLFQRLAAARAGRPDMRVINIDPRRTASSDLADLHLSIRPDGDAALYNLLLAEIAARGAVDADYLAAHVDGFDAAVTAARATDPAETGLSPEEIARFCDMWIGAERVVTLYSQGVNQSSCGSDKVNAIVNCHLATGRIGRPGMGPFSLTGQPNAMGGREVGGLANMLACHLDIEDPAHRDAVQGAWNSPVICQTPGLKAVDLFDACADGRIKALWIISTNPAVSMPDAGRVAEAIARVPFTVISDIVSDTDTARLCRVQLPAAGWGEKSGTVTNSERCISRQRAFLPVPGEARADWRILAQVGARMGWANAFGWTSEAAVFREFAALSGLAEAFGRDFDISGLADLSDAAYDALKPVHWPVPRAGRTPPTTAGRFFGAGGFYHPGGRARMLPITPPQVQLAAADWPFRLNTGRVRDHWHTMTRTGRSARLSGHIAEPYAEIHPDDAAMIGVADAELVGLETETGRAVLRVLISDRAQRGTVFVPMHWTAETAPSGRVNRAVRAAVDPVSGQPALKGSAARLRRWTPAWYGFAASRAEMRAGPLPYWAGARSDTGMRAELAGALCPDSPEAWEAEARRVLNLDGGAASVLSDPARGSVSVAIVEHGTLAGLFWAGPAPVAVARAHACALIGTDTAPARALAGRPGTDQPDPGPLVCSCFGIGANQIRAAVADGAVSVEAVGACTQAGTNCGSCRPEIKGLIAAAQTPKMAAE